MLSGTSPELEFIAFLGLLIPQGLVFRLLLFSKDQFILLICDHRDLGHSVAVHVLLFNAKLITIVYHIVARSLHGIKLCLTIFLSNAGRLLVLDVVPVLFSESDAEAPVLVRCQETVVSGVTGCEQVDLVAVRLFQDQRLVQLVDDHVTLDNAEDFRLFVRGRRRLNQRRKFDPLQLVLLPSFTAAVLELEHLDHVGHPDFLEAESLTLVVALRLHEEFGLNPIVEVYVRVRFRLQ